jgi:hypothetical protein
MKSILALAATLSLFANAARAEKVLAEVRTVDAQIQSVQLTDSGALNILLRNGSKKRAPLAASNVSELTNLATYLGGVDLQSEHHVVICMMMLAYPQNLYLADAKTGEAKLVLSPRSCAIANQVFPKQAYDLESAVELEKSLIVLARQLAN